MTTSVLQEGIQRIRYAIALVSAILVNCYASLGFADQPITVVLIYERGGCGTVDASLDLNKLAEALNRRLGPDAKAKAVSDERVQVEVYGKRDKAALDLIKRRITDSGCLEFRILANSNYPADAHVIDQAKRADPNQHDVLVEGKKVAEWVPYSQAEFGPADRDKDGMVKRLAGDVPEALALIDEISLTGEFLTSATKGLDEQGGLAVHFSLNREGAKRMRELTSQNMPDAANLNLYRHLGIILDKRLFSAYRIHATISDRGIISGGSMSDAEVASIVDTLNSGSLPKVIQLVEEKRITGEN